MIENFIDIRLTPEGDFELDENNDIRLTTLTELVEQKVHIALKTSNPDWFSELVGADLEDFLGMEHTKSTADLAKRRVSEALTAHGFFQSDEVFIETKPYNKTTMLLMLYINLPDIGETQVYRIAIDLGDGASVRRVF